MSEHPSRAARILVFAGVLAASALGVGCLPGRRAAVHYRPSAQEVLAEERMLSQPFAIAVPEDAIVRIVGRSTTCTGTLIDDDLILTAHHCVAVRGPKGEFQARNLEPGDLRVELGGDDFAWGEVGVRHVVTPPCGEGGGAGDVAVLVLSRKLIGISTMTARLEAPPKVGEDVYPIGFGRCALSADAIHRRTRSGGPIRAISGETLHVDASICPGDSGGPVLLAGSREIVGVVSLSAMDHDERTVGPSVMARIDSYRMVFTHARMLADGDMSPAELPPLECGTYAAKSPTKPSHER